MSHSVTSFVIPLLSILTLAVLICLIALIDFSMERFWGSRHSFLKAFLSLFSLLSAFYQVAFLLHLPLLFSIIDWIALALAVIFWRPIFRRLERYTQVVASLLKEEGKWSFSLFYILLFYNLLLAAFSVPGLNWDSMIFELSRPFLYLNEGGIFTTHYSDARQVAWPIGFDSLLYIFTRHGGETVGVGLIPFLFYLATLIGIYGAISEKKDLRLSRTLLFVSASFPLLLYCATSNKSDTAITFSLLLMWLFFDAFRKTRLWTDLYFVLLAFSFGLSCKLSFLLFGGLSLIAFIILEIKNRSLLKPLSGIKLRWFGLFLFILLCLLLSQVHLYIHNIAALGYLEGDAVTHQMTPKQDWVAILQNYFKYHLMFVDFVLPLSKVGIPFVDTLLNFIYNNTIGVLTGEKPWRYHYFPDEMRGSFGPFGIVLLWGIYATPLKGGKVLSKTVALVSLFCLIFTIIKFPWLPWPPFRYVMPVVVLSFAFLPVIHDCRFFRYAGTIRWSSLLLLLFCSVVNYPKPLIAYHRQAVPWYRNAFTDRNFRYRENYFYDDRMEIYRNMIRTGEKILVLGTRSTWTYPFYHHALKSSTRLADYKYRRSTWDNNEYLQKYDWIICNGRECVEEFESRGGFRTVWKSAPEIYRQGAFFQPQP